MRLRNLKNKEEIIKNSSYVVKDPNVYVGKWRDIFGNNNPIYIEIGMGKGKFIVENALKFPNINFIGIEKVDNVLARALPSIPEGIDNLKIIRMNALSIDEVFSHEIDRIYLNFSDPWPKVRHNERRLTSKIFLNKYSKIFGNQGEIFLRTDNQELYIYSIESLSRLGYLLSEVTFDLHKDNDGLITTEYEDKFTANGDKIYALRAIKAFK